MARLWLAAAAAASAVLAADPLFERAWNKLDAIESGRARPGSVVTLTPDELNAWVRVRVGQMTEGLRNPRVELGAGTATGSALVDVVKLRESEGVNTNPVLAKLLEGERPIKVTVRLESAAGQCTVHPLRVEISGVAATGPVLNMLVAAFLQPLFPDARIGQPFELGDHIERIDVRPAGLRVIIRK